MPTTPHASDLAAILPGVWNVRATNFPMWLTRERKSPRFSYDLVSENPLTLRNDVSYFTADNQEKHVLGTDKWADDHFVWRGKSLLKLARSRWAVSGKNDASTVLAIRFDKTAFTPAGIDVIVREAVEIDELRSLVARNTEQFGLTAEDFASLTWLD
ncbi:hypothetical protein [Conyzicola sp.]|uniref:hypothetical protein n=1 Tax=Conyzicola sp. TaxID=1969404 RepID=UPI00398919B9